MKLLLQLLFVQGWLWRDRFPEAFAKANVERTIMGRLMVILPIMLILAGAGMIAGGAGSSGGPVSALGLVWLLWYGTSLGIRTDAVWKELWISLSWASGFLFVASILGFAAIAIALADWLLLVACAVFFLCLGSGWLRGFQSNYLFFRDPASNMWRLEERPPEKGLIRPLINQWVETYWRLPQQIFLPMRGRHHGE